MYLAKPQKAVLKKIRGDSVYDDEDSTEVDIDLVHYNTDMAIRFGIVSVPEAKGYFITRNIDVKEGDQIIYNSHIYTVIQVNDRWQFNKVVNIVLAVK